MTDLSPKKQPSKPIRHAVILGLLTFAITPLAALIIGVPLLLFGKMSEELNPLIVIAKTLNLTSLGGFFAAQFLFLGLLALIGDFAAAIISWRTSHSKKLAVITFLSAITFQCLVLGTVLPIRLKLSQRSMEAGIDREQAYAQLATIGEIGYEVHGQYSDQEMTNLHPEYGPIYRKLEIVVPISVSQAGLYLVTAEYGFANEAGRFSSRIKSIEQVFEAKDHTVKIEFRANESIGGYGHWSPAKVGGSVELQLNYLAAKEGTGRQQQAVSKFVGRQEAQF